MTGEASTSYILNPHALKRISQIVPQAKLILLLRNPIDRAYSHYQHTVRRGEEHLSFEDAIKLEVERVGRSWRQLLEDETCSIDAIDAYGYLSSGIYADQVKVLLSLFPREQVLILDSDDLFTNPSITFRQVLDILDVPRWEPRDFDKFNAGNYSNMDASVRKPLVDYFKPHNQRLSEYLGVRFDWDK